MREREKQPSLLAEKEGYDEEEDWGFNAPVSL